MVKESRDVEYHYEKNRDKVLSTNLVIWKYEGLIMEFDEWIICVGFETNVVDAALPEKNYQCCSGRKMLPRPGAQISA